MMWCQVILVSRNKNVIGVIAFVVIGPKHARASSMSGLAMTTALASF